uniref:Uncharacterized protein n=1 Tax=Arundo donax TaxID=35708 RepID=A0A0A9DTJ3_ARUDO
MFKAMTCSELLSRQFQVGLPQQPLWPWDSSSIRRKGEVHFLLAELSAPALLLKKYC